MGQDKQEEEQLIDSFENDEWESTAGSQRRFQLQEYARSTIAKDKRITLRLTSGDLSAIQALAIQEGIPYQTLISSIVHKYVTGRLIDKRD